MPNALKRRRHPRFGVRRIVSYRYEGKRFLTLTLDLGLGGMKIETSASLPKDECLDFQLVLENTSLWLKGRTVYSQLVSDRKNASGIRFLNVSEKDRVLLQNCLTRL